MKPATSLIHAGESAAPANPLTTPIYETATFVFDSAQEVVAYNEGRSRKYLYSRYANPTVVSVEAASKRIADGELLEVDGSRGVVTGLATG